MAILTLTLLPEKLGVYRMAAGSPLPNLPVDSGSFFSVTLTTDEVSVVCRADLVPASVPAEKTFRAFKVEGPLAFDLIGILAALLKPLAAAGISVFAVSTYDTDYIMVKEESLAAAQTALRKVAVLTS